MEEKDVKNNLLKNKLKIKKARYLLISLLIMEIIISLLKFRLSIFYFCAEIICVVILIPTIYSMHYDGCVSHAIFILFNFIVMINYFVQTLLKSARFMSFSSPQILISYISFGFYTIDLVFIFSVYKILKSNSYYQLLYHSLLNSSQVKNINNNKDIKKQYDTTAITENSENCNKKPIQKQQLVNQNQQKQSNTNKYTGHFSNLKV
ncbi:hypothetical protein ABPG72_005655 [Tetrahymena utriculariae]